ncbi:tRNA 2-thiouridine(34) synthase MnmA [Candidatus Marinamargulisbacteria bacterium SCGC AG-343-D04]|nr:tRNA 2-thiouridine(34) synthase MnmA [Candidatus Marinamargulisbacteria bacterium SCGC AG-343-D04]
MKRKKRVLVGMSGGIDSSVCAAILKKRGYDVIGITMQLLPKEMEKESKCCNSNAITDAKRVAQQLNIPHYTINIRDDFKHHVIDYFVNEYLLGHTPNPCVECNRYIKFDALDQKAKELDADYVATGHYCKITHSPKKDRFFLKKAKDIKKDQTYFMYMLTQYQLSRTLFPLSDYTKPEIRAIAESLQLINAKKKESQDICFVTMGNYKEFIEEQLTSPQKEGNIVTNSGEILGKHHGLYNYTVGQRKGLNISYEHPLYVLKINAQKNEIVVGKESDLQQHSFEVNEYHLINKSIFNEKKEYSIKVRYRMIPFKATIKLESETKMTIHSHSPLKFITTGQSCVIYDNENVIGGGIIV